MRLRALLVLCLFSGCLNFDERLAQCRDGGAWRCGADAGPGATDGGGGGMGATASVNAGELLCIAGVCWDHPRSTGLHFTAAAGSPDDAWLAGWPTSYLRAEPSWLLHFDGQRWAAFSFNRQVTGVCVHEGRVFAVAGSGSEPISHFDADAGRWQALGSATLDARVVACGARGLWVGSTGGLTQIDYASGAAVTHWAAPSGPYETPLALTELPADVLMATRLEGQGRSRVRHVDGAIETEWLTTGPNEEVTPFWWGPDGDLWIGESDGAGPAKIRARGDGGWQPVPDFTGFMTLHSVAVIDGGFLAGGEGEVLRAFGGAPQVEPVNAGVIGGLFAADDGTAMAFGSRGCIFSRAASGLWSSASACERHFSRVWVGASIYGLTTTGAALQRADAGWVSVGDVPSGLSIAQTSGGQAVVLSSTNVWIDGAPSPELFSGAVDWAMRADGTGVVVLDAGTIGFLDVGGPSFTPGVLSEIAEVKVDRTTGRFWALRIDGALSFSDDGKHWTEETADHGGIPDDWLVFNGDVWVYAQAMVWHRDRAGAWAQADGASGTGEQLVPRLIPAGDHAVTLHWSGPATLPDSAGLAAYDYAGSPLQRTMRPNMPFGIAGGVFPAQGGSFVILSSGLVWVPYRSSP